MTKISNQPAIAEIRDLQIQYRSESSIVHAVQGASMVVGESQTVGIVGESGSGKSTVARAILGLLDQRNASIVGGNIIIAGRDVTHLGQNEWKHVRGNPVAMVFQDPLTYLNPVLTVGRQIEESIRLHDRGASVGERVKELLGMVKLPATVAKSYPDELSGGMRQRVLLAIALACRPRLLIADEPTTALDVTTQAEIMELLRELQSELKMAMLLISHDLGLVASVCDNLYVMYAGRTIEWGATKPVFKEPRHPYTRGLLAAAEGRRSKDGRFITIGGDGPNLKYAPVGCSFKPRCSLADDRCDAMPKARQMNENPRHFVRCYHSVSDQISAEPVK
jgi:oligopeptide/dipeptide ABC transporter ATP-binding protein